MIITERVLDAKTGEYFEREINLPGLMTEAEGIAKDARDAKEAANAEILATLAANDAKAVRALLDGDTARIAAHKAAQAELRAMLK